MLNGNHIELEHFSHTITGKIANDVGIMPCAVAVANSPVFMSSPTMFSRKPTISVSSPSTIFLHQMSSAVTSPSSTAAISSAPALTLKLHKPISTGFTMDFIKEGQICSVSPSLSSPPAALKRKRPARIDIPNAVLSFFETAVDVKRVDEVTEVDEEGEAYSVYCKRGKRSVMEDRFSAVVDMEGNSKQAFFGVFDGHGGVKAAEFTAKNLDRNIMREVINRCDEEIEDAVKEGYLATDKEFLEQDVNGGTCCVTALIRNGSLIVSNAGDCRAVMSRGGVAEALTIDHKPSRKDEKERVESLGGYVDCCRGVWRIQGSLAVSRGIGDKHLKQWVTAEPETTILSITPDCEFLILASDGLWDKVSNQEAVDVVRPFCVGVDSPNLSSAYKELANLSVARGSADDTSVMVIQLPNILP